MSPEHPAAAVLADKTLMLELLALVTSDQLERVHRILIWAAVAFCLWLALAWLVRRLRVPNPVLIAATLSWVVAWLFIQVVPLVLHELGAWPMR